MQRMQCIYIATWLIAVFTSPIVIANNTNINGSTNNNGNGTINIFDASSNNDIHTLTVLVMSSWEDLVIILSTLIIIR